MVRQIRVTKQPRSAPLLDLPPAFPPLLYLRLDLVEVKKKLKNNVNYVFVTFKIETHNTGYKEYHVKAMPS